MNYEDIRALKLFNEKADKLFNSEFIKKLCSKKCGFTLFFKKGISGTLRGPNETSIEAFATTFRFFIQDNEPSSIRNLSKIYFRLKIPNCLKKEFKEL